MFFSCCTLMPIQYKYQIDNDTLKLYSVKNPLSKPNIG